MTDTTITITLKPLRPSGRGRLAYCPIYKENRMNPYLKQMAFSRAIEYLTAILGFELETETAGQTNLSLDGDLFHLELDGRGAFHLSNKTDQHFDWQYIKDAMLRQPDKFTPALIVGKHLVFSVMVDIRDIVESVSWMG